MRDLSSIVADLKMEKEKRRRKEGKEDPDQKKKKKTTWRKLYLKKMEDAELRQHNEERVGQIVDDGSGEQTTRRRDERRQVAVGFFHRNEAKFEDGALRVGEVDGRISVDIDVVEVFGRAILEKLLPERGKVEVGVSEEEESDLEFGVFGGKVGECVGWVGERGGAVEEEEVIELVEERDWDGRVTPTKLDLRKKKIWIWTKKELESLRLKFQVDIPST